MPRKAGLTMKEHREVGARLYVLRNELWGITVLLSRAYPIQSPICRLVERMARTADELRSNLENAMFREHPKDAEIRVYYPGSKQ